MKKIKTQSGISAIGLLGVMFIGIFSIIFAVNTLPSYLGNITLNSVLSDIAEEYAGKELPPNELRTIIRKRLESNSLTAVRDLDIKLQKTNNKTLILIDYEVRKKLMANISIVMSFSNRQEV